MINDCIFQTSVISAKSVYYVNMSLTEYSLFSVVSLLSNFSYAKLLKKPHRVLAKGMVEISPGNFQKFILGQAHWHWRIGIFYLLCFILQGWHLSIFSAVILQSLAPLESESSSVWWTFHTFTSCNMSDPQPRLRAVQSHFLSFLHPTLQATT